PSCDERAVTRLGIALDAEERRDPRLRQLFDEGREIGAVEDLARVPLHVGRRERDPRALADALPVVLLVLKMTKRRRRGELGVVAVLDGRLRESCLQAPCVRPGVFAAADAAAL